MSTQVWFVTALNLPGWLTDIDERIGNRLTIHKRDGVDYVVTPDGEDVVLVTESGNHMQPLVYQDILAIRKWKERGGPRWEKGVGVNLNRGERMRMVPYSAIGGRESEYEQPWQEDENDKKLRLALTKLKSDPNDANAWREFESAMGRSKP